MHLQALVCAHTSLPLLSDGERFSQTFLAHPGMGR